MGVIKEMKSLTIGIGLILVGVLVGCSNSKSYERFFKDLNCFDYGRDGIACQGESFYFWSISEESLKQFIKDYVRTTK